MKLNVSLPRQRLGNRPSIGEDYKFSSITDELRGRSMFLEHKDKRVPNKDEIREICTYLQNPTKSGIWYLTGQWEKVSGVSEYIVKKLEKQFDRKKSIEIKSDRRKIRLKLDNDQKMEIFIAVTSKISFINSVFTYLYLLESKAIASLEYRELRSDKYNFIFELLDLKSLKKKYAEAYKYFKDEIYFPGFSPIINENKLFYIKDGFILLLEFPEESEKVSFASIRQEPLEKMRIFLSKVGKITEHSVYPVFSPEEYVFAPYFSLLQSTYHVLFGDSHVEELFEKSFDEYSQENFIGCISTIGFIAEDYLTQVYETFFREVCPKGLTLGQIYDLIHASIQKKYQSTPAIQPNLDPLYKKIRDKLQQIESDPTTLTEKDNLILVREVLNYLKDDRKYFRYLISSLDKKVEGRSCFPQYLRENLIELIKNRNAASHKSRVPIGSYEALRTVYCLITLYMWWNAEKKLIDWKDDPDVILRKSLERNSEVCII